DLRGDQQIAVARVRTRADRDLLDRRARDLIDPNDVIGRVRKRDKRPEAGEIDHHRLGVPRIGIRAERTPNRLAALGGQIQTGLPIAREYRGRRAKHRTYVRERGAVWHRRAAVPWT